MMSSASLANRALPALGLLLAPFALGYFCSYFFRNINAVAGPLLAHEFALGPSELGLLTGAYFIAFAVAQIPIGIALDRFGPSRVDGVLLALIAAGALIFAISTNLATLAVGRAMIGAGAAGMLMSCMSAVPMWAAKERVATYMGFATAIGGLGAIVAATPVALAIESMGWRNVFLIGGAFALLVGVGAVSTQRWVRVKSAGQSLPELLRGVRTVFATPRLWQLGLASVFVLGNFQAFQSLWAATWLRDVAGSDRITVGNVLVVLNIGMVVGFFTCGWISDQLAARGVHPFTTVKGMVVVALLAQGWILLAPDFMPHLAWAIYSFGANSLILTFPVVGREFSGALTGRVNTCLNLFCFVVAFVVQWAVGATLNIFPVTDGRYDREGYYWAWLVLLGVQAAVLVYTHWVTRDFAAGRANT
ncbi:MAG: nitrate/nitrite transporter [Burkholderiales bacterium]